MTGSSLQEKIDKLQNTVHALLHKSHSMECVYIDDIARLNKEIHEQIINLFMNFFVQSCNIINIYTLHTMTFME